MTDISNLLGFSVIIDDENSQIIFGNDISPQERNVGLKDITPTLLNKYLKYPEVVYRYHPNIRKTKCTNCELSYNMFLVPYGLLGVEFNKTHVFYEEPVDNKYSSLVEVHAGSLSVIIQRNQERDDEWDYNTYIEELKVIHLKAGQKLAIPSGVYYSFVNTGLCPAVFSNISLTNLSNIDYDIIKREKGMACFIISKNSKIATVANPKYKILSKLQSNSLEKFMKDDDFRSVYYKPFSENSEPLINLMNNVEILNQYFY